MKNYLEEKVKIFCAKSGYDRDYQNKSDSSIIVNIDFGMEIRIGDIIVFPDENKPKWVIDSENYEELKGFSVTIVERYIHNEKLVFYAIYS